MSDNAALINEIAQAMSDAKFTFRTKEVYAQALTDAQDNLVEKTEALIQINTSDVVLVADTQEYSLPATFIKFPTRDSDIDRAFVAVGNNGKVPLAPITLSLLNSRYSNWRSQASGTPEFYYLVRSGTPKIGIWPAPSAAWITANGSKVYMEHVYRPAAISYGSSLPFDGGFWLQGLQIAMKFKALWYLLVQDRKFTDADKLDAKVRALEDEAKELVDSAISTPFSKGFGDSVRQF